MATVTSTHAIASLPLPAPELVYRLTVEQFDGMVRSGFLDEDDPVQLINGILVTKLPKNPHFTVCDEEGGPGGCRLCFPGAGLSRRKILS